MKSTIIIFLIFIYEVRCALEIPNIKLNNGHTIPMLGLGTSRMTGETVFHAVYDAIEIGYRHIDTSDNYHNDPEVGKGINQAIKDGKVKREELFIVSKVSINNQKRNETLQSVKDSLKRMNLKYLDMMLIHRPYNGYLEIWKGLEDAVEQGLVKSIGLSNFDKQMIDIVIKNSKIKPANLQNQITPENPSDNLIEYCHDHNITITSWGSLGRGKLLNETTVMKIATHKNKSTAQILLRFEVQRGVIVIPKASSKAHLIDNTKIFDWKLTDDEMKQIHSIENNFAF